MLALAAVLYSLQIPGASDKYQWLAKASPPEQLAMFNKAIESVSEAAESARNRLLSRVAGEGGADRSAYSWDAFEAAFGSVPRAGAPATPSRGQGATGRAEDSLGSSRRPQDTPSASPADRGSLSRAPCGRGSAAAAATVDSDTDMLPGTMPHGTRSSASASAVRRKGPLRPTGVTSSDDDTADIRALSRRLAFAPDQPTPSGGDPLSSSGAGSLQSAISSQGSAAAASSEATLSATDVAPAASVQEAYVPAPDRVAEAASQGVFSQAPPTANKPTESQQSPSADSQTRNDHASPQHEAVAGPAETSSTPRLPVATAAVADPAAPAGKVAAGPKVVIKRRGAQ